MDQAVPELVDSKRYGNLIREWKSTAELGQGSAFEFCSGFLTNWGATPLSVYFSTFFLGILYACKPVWGCVGLYSKFLKLLSKYEWEVTNFKCNKCVRDRRVTVTLGMLTLQWLEKHVLSILPLQQKWQESWVSLEKRSCSIQIFSIYQINIHINKTRTIPVIQFSKFNVVVTAPVFVICSGMKNHQFLLWKKTPHCPKYFHVFINQRNT